jgi:hypothetical protein
MDDIDDTQFYNKIDDGIINFFMADWIGYLYFTDGQIFDTFNEYIGISEGEIEFDIPANEMWYAMFNIGDNLNNPQNLIGSAKLYEYNVNSIYNNEIPNSTQLHNNYPNPFNPTTTINYSLNYNSNVTLEVFNIKGQKIKTLENEDKIAGNHSLIWNGKDSDDESVASGVYFYKLVSEEHSFVKKMVLMK